MQHRPPSPGSSILTFALRKRPASEPGAAANGKSHFPLASGREQRTATHPSVPAPGKVLSVLVWHWGRSGAGPKFTFELARALKERPDLEVSVSASSGSDLDALCGAADIEVDRVNTFDRDKAGASGRMAALLGLTGLPSLTRDFGRIVERRRTAIALCAFQSIWDLAALRCLRLSRGRFVLVLHDAAFHDGDAYPFRTRILKREVAAADALIVLSDHVAAQAGTMHGFPPDRIWTVPHGSFSFGAPRSRGRGHPQGRPFRLLFLGRIVAYKGLDLLARTYRLLLNDGVAVELSIFGDGDMAPYRAAFADLPGLTIVNRWLDDIDIAGALDAADLLVLPYVEASQSGVAASAMTDGLPVVVTPVGGLAEQVSDGVTGLVAAAVTADALAAAIARMVADGPLYEACSSGALRHAVEDLGWRVVAGRVDAILRTVAAMPRRASN